MSIIHQKQLKKVCKECGQTKVALHVERWRTGGLRERTKALEVTSPVSVLLLAQVISYHIHLTRDDRR